MEEEIIDEIKNLFEELKDIRKGKLLYNKYPLPPSGESFYVTAKNLTEKVEQLSYVNNSYSAIQLYDVLGEEVESVRNYRYEYKLDGGQIKPSSLDKMDSLMRDALVHIRLECYDILGESKIE